jgi:hypothetical protein
MCNSLSFVPKVNNVEGTVESILAFKPQYLFEKFLPFKVIKKNTQNNIPICGFTVILLLVVSRFKKL